MVAPDANRCSKKQIVGAYSLKENSAVEPPSPETPYMTVASYTRLFPRGSWKTAGTQGGRWKRCKNTSSHNHMVP